MLDVWLHAAGLATGAQPLREQQQQNVDDARGQGSRRGDWAASRGAPFKVCDAMPPAEDKHRVWLGMHRLPWREGQEGPLALQ